MDLRDDYSFCRELLAPDEQVLWTGKPNQGTIFSVFTGSSLLVTFLVFGFSFFMYHLVKTYDDSLFYLFWVFFMGLCIYSVTIWPFQAYFLRKHTFYVITNKKIYRKRGRKITKLSAKDMPSYETNYHNNSTGSIRFTLYVTPHWANGETIEKHFTLENLKDITRAQQAIAQMDTE